MWTTVSILTSATYSQAQGSQRFFHLPDFGTYDLPEKLRSISMPGYDDDQIFAPRSLVTAVDFGELADQEAAASVSPPLTDPGELVWVESSSIEGRGVITDMVAQKKSDRDLFLLGAAIAVLTSLTAFALRLWVKAVKLAVVFQRGPRGRAT
jgi:hypothetical protein